MKLKRTMALLATGMMSASILAGCGGITPETTIVDVAGIVQEKMDFTIHHSEVQETSVGIPHDSEEIKDFREGDVQLTEMVSLEDWMESCPVIEPDEIKDSEGILIIHYEGIVKDSEGNGTVLNARSNYSIDYGEVEGIHVDDIIETYCVMDSNRNVLARFDIMESCVKE